MKNEKEDGKNKRKLYSVFEKSGNGLVFFEPLQMKYKVTISFSSHQDVDPQGKVLSSRSQSHKSHLKRFTLTKIYELHKFIQVIRLKKKKKLFKLYITAI